MVPMPLKFKVGDAVQWVGKIKGAKGVLADGIVSNMPTNGTRYEVFITKAYDPQLTAAKYFIEAAKLVKVEAPPAAPQ